MKNTILIILTLVFFTSCSKDEPAIDYSQQNDTEIQAYIAANNLNAQETGSGLYYIIDEVGTGESPTLNDRIKAKYKGYLTNGTVFHELDENAVSNFLGNLLLGWQEGLSHFKEGGSGTLIIPAHLGYGGSANGSIPAGSVLIFEIELVYVNYEKENDEQIQAYLTENNLTAEKSSTGLYYIIDTLGTGVQPTTTDNVTVAYKGYFLNDTVFDQSSEAGVAFNLQQVIKGWTEGITYFNEGGSGMLLVPAHLGYGTNDYSTIPGGSVLIFDIELLSIN